MSQYDQFVVDSLTVAGAAISIEESSTTVENILGYENEATPAASGPHGQIRKRVVPKIKTKINFFQDITSEEVKIWDDVQVVLRQIHTNKRVRCSNCSVAKLGDVGNGAADLEFNVLGRVQWL